MIDSGIFKKYDIRGKAEGDNAPVTPEAAHKIGQAFGTYLQQHENKKTAAFSFAGFFTLLPDRCTTTTDLFSEIKNSTSNTIKAAIKNQGKKL